MRSAKTERVVESFRSRACQQYREYTRTVVVQRPVLICWFPRPRASMRKRTAGSTYFVIERRKRSCFRIKRAYIQHGQVGSGILTTDSSRSEWELSLSLEALVSTRILRTMISSLKKTRQEPDGDSLRGQFESDTNAADTPEASSHRERWEYTLESGIELHQSSMQQ